LLPVARRFIPHPDPLDLVAQIILFSAVIFFASVAGGV
jgi:hypothetical protein